MNVIQRERRFPSATGNCDIRYRMWIPQEVRAAVQLTHGMAEHIDRYQDFAMFLAENGILVYGQDHAGHGKSIREGGIKGFFAEEKGWDALVQDAKKLYSLVKGDYPAIPFILFGHSMGSFIARSYAARKGDDFDAFIFSGTAGKNPVLPIGKLLAKWEVRRTGGKVPSDLLKSMAFGTYNQRIKPSRTEYDWLSRDEAVVDAYMMDPLCGFTFTSSAMLDLFTGLMEISSSAWAKKVPDKPIFVYAGDQDPVGNYGKGVRQVAKWLQKSGHTLECRLYEGGRHEMHNETNRSEVYGDILLFIEAVAVQGELE